MSPDLRQRLIFTLFHILKHPFSPFVAFQGLFFFIFCNSNRQLSPLYSATEYRLCGNGCHIAAQPISFCLTTNIILSCNGCHFATQNSIGYEVKLYRLSNKVPFVTIYIKLYLLIFRVYALNIKIFLKTRNISDLMC